MRMLRCGLIGDGLGRSRFGTALKILAQAHGMGTEFELIDTAGATDFDLPLTLVSLQQKGWTGVSITHPHKRAAAAWVGRAIAPEIQPLGACNLIVFSPQIRGFNTDFDGFVGAWRDQFGQRTPGRVAMAGAGGVAGALAGALLSLGADDIVVWDLDPGLARQLATRLESRVRAVPIAEAHTEMARADGLVNATPVGMGEDRRSAFPTDQIGAQTWAFDAVYTPTDTEFMKAAGTHGLACLSGFQMFTFMAVHSFAAYAGLPPAPELTKLLVGLQPGAGSGSVAQSKWAV